MEIPNQSESSYQETNEEQSISPNQDEDGFSNPASEPNQPPNPQPIPSLTLSLFRHLFDDRLSWSRKIGCMTATLAINLFLPFINGIMLGFGEIAARELVGRYLGWGPLKELYQSSHHKNQVKSYQNEDDLVSLQEPTQNLTISSDQTRWWISTNQNTIDQR